MARARARRGGFDIWPGFVDALTQLLMVVIFIVLVFTVSHFYLGYTLEGRDAAVERLNQQVGELADMLALERTASGELKIETERLAVALDAANRNRDSLAGQLTALMAERQELSAALTERTGERDRARSALDQRTTERDVLARDLTAEQGRAMAAVADVARLEAALAAAQRTVTADKETIETQLRDLARLSRDLDALRTLRADLERQVANLSATLSATAERATEVDAERARQERQSTERAAALEAARSRIAGLGEEATRRETALAEADRRTRALAAESESRGGDIARLEQQLHDLASAVAERDARIRTLSAAIGEESSRRQADARTAEAVARAAEADARAAQQTAGVLRDRARELEARLADQQERTLLAQRTIEDNAIRLRALFLRAERGEREVDAERQSGDSARDSLRVLTAELEGLKRELAKLNAVLEASETLNRSQQVQIVDLGSRLNQALATKVEELSRYRSEFFGRMRALLGDRPDVEIVGDRFVFPAEVLFAVGSPELNDTGKSRMADLARTFKEIAATIPNDLPWILRVDGHTDRTRVRSPLFRHNWDLSAARAVNVVQFLIEQGIPANRLAATGFGEFQPIDSGSSDAALARNRRIEIKLTER